MSTIQTHSDFRQTFGPVPNSLVFGQCPKSEQKLSVFGRFLASEIQTGTAQTEQFCSDFGQFGLKAQFKPVWILDRFGTNLRPERLKPERTEI